MVVVSDDLTGSKIMKNKAPDSSDPDVVASGETLSATDADIDKLTTFAVVLGRGVACRADVEPAMKRVGRWMDVKFPPGSRDQQIYLPIFMEGVRHLAEHPTLVVTSSERLPVPVAIVDRMAPDALYVGPAWL